MTKPVIGDDHRPITRQIEGDISFNNIDFTYDHTGIEALKNFDLHIKRGEKVAIVGRTGSGKSTVAQLLLRMHDVSTGSITIDGIDIRKYHLQNLREQISYVPQDVFLFSDTIASNISFGLEKIDIDRVRNAAQMASIAREVNSFPEQFETVVGERGVTLSGGQKQRISIARALIKDPNLVISH